MSLDHNNVTEDLLEQELQLRSLVDVGDIHFNVSQSFVITTEDKLRLCLNGHLGRLERKREWLTPFGLLLAIVTTLATTDFRAFGLSAETWYAIFLMTGVVSFFWLVWTLSLLKTSANVEDIIKELKNNPTQDIKRKI